MSEQMTADEALMLLEWMTQDRDAVKAGRDRLREALEAILAYVPEGFVSPVDDDDTLNVRGIAREALEGMRS